MPGMSGFDVCSALRELPDCRHVPILMQTSLDDMESVNRAYNAGATDFSSKGINPMLLAQRVKFLVRAKQTQDQLRESEARVRYLAYYDPLTALAQPPAAAADTGTAGRLGRPAAARPRRPDARRRQLLPHQRHAGAGGGRRAVEGDRASACRTACATPSAPWIKRTTPSKRRTSTTGWRAPAAMNSRWRCPGYASAEAGAGRGAARAAGAGAAIRLRAAGNSAVGQHGHQLVSGRRDHAGSACQECGRGHASRQEGGTRQGSNSSINRSARARPSTCPWKPILRKALERGEFTLNYQPRLALNDLRVEAVEALLRWWHPAAGLRCRPTSSFRSPNRTV